MGMLYSKLSCTQKWLLWLLMVWPEVFLQKSINNAKKANDHRRSVLTCKYLLSFQWCYDFIFYGAVALKCPCKVISGTVILKIDIKMNICVPLFQAKFCFIVSSSSSRSLYSSFLYLECICQWLWQIAEYVFWKQVSK